jgi:two-component system, LuxR family, sensor kinase FixL
MESEERESTRSSQIPELLILKHAVENTNEAFVTIDQNHRVLIFNRAAEKIFGYDRDEVIGHDLTVIMAPTCARDHRKAVDRYVRTKVPRRIGHVTEMIGTRRNGETFPVSISFSVTEVEGAPYFTGLVRDLTETKALQEKISQAERLAVLGQLVAEISHEIKNPLMSIGGFARQVLQATRDKKNREKLEIIANEVSRLEKLLADLREFYLSKPLETGPVDLRALVEEIFALVEDACRRSHITLQLEGEEKGVIVAADPDRLKQVLLNLVKNAIEAMEETGGTLRVRITRSEGKAQVTVIDTGGGIPEKHRGNIFSPFFTTKKQGSGLGLAICKRIIEQHPGSTFVFETSEGKGTQFQIGLPLHSPFTSAIDQPADRN